MEALGERISEQRNKLGLTQKELGQKLNVSAQAVSKWENGQSEPDIDTVKNMCALFGVSVDEFLGISPAQAPDAAAAASDAQPAAPQQPQTNSLCCERCKKPVGPGEYSIEQTGNLRNGYVQHIYCYNCINEMRASYDKCEYENYKEESKKSYLFGGIAGGIALVAGLLIFLLATDLPVPAAIVLGIVVGLGFFAFITQMFWDGVVSDFFGVFFHSFNMPGVIFTLDIGGIVFLITVKVFLAVLSVFLSVMWFLLGMTVILPLFSLFVFPFALLARLHGSKKRKAESDRSAAKVQSAADGKAEQQ